LNICIEATPIGVYTTDRGGVYRYISNLIEAISRADHGNSYTLFYNFFRKEHYRFFRQNANRLKVGENFSVRVSRFPSRLQRVIEPPAELLAGRFDVFHGCFDYLRPVLYGKGVVTVHDIRYLENIDDTNDPQWGEIVRRSSPSPDFHMKDLLNRDKLFNHLKSSIRKTVRRADLVITVSEFSRRRIMDRLGLPPEKVRVIYHGIGKEFFPRDEGFIRPVLDHYGIDRPYLLYTGKFEPLKNIGRLLEAFQKVSARTDVRLVMAGPANWYYYVILEKVRQMGIAEKVVFTGFVTDTEMNALYSGASVFVSPSIYEGFGLPLLEAMACGAPVVTSNVCSIPEVVGDAALFADPCSSADIADRIIQCLEDDVLRTALIDKGRKQAQSFTWEDTAFKTLQVYKEACR